MSVFNYLVYAGVAYIIGSIPTGYLAGRLRGLDIRSRGSGNIGATNAYRILGPVSGVLVFAGDVLKGYLAVDLGRFFGGESLALITGLMVLIGHNWSVFLSFRGGKGVATGLGVILGIHIATALSALGLWAVITVLTGYVSLGSVLAVASVPVFMLVYRVSGGYFLGLAIPALIIYRHRENIKRLFRGKEPRARSILGMKRR